MDTGFVDALKVPAILSTLRKVQHDSDRALRVLNTYYRTNKYCEVRAPLSGVEEEALSDILANAVEQSLGAIMLFAAAHGAFVQGGVMAGQAAQVFISVNAMTAPKSQFVNPGRLFGRWSGRAGMANLEVLPSGARILLAFELGRLAEATGYRNHYITTIPKASIGPDVEARAVITFSRLPPVGAIASSKQ